MLCSFSIFSWPHLLLLYFLNPLSIACVLFLELEMTTCCQRCGAAGFLDLLVYCSECRTSAEHRYCMDKIPKKDELEVHWLCEQCKPRYSKVASIHKLTFDRKRTKNIQKCQHQQINFTNDSPKMKTRYHSRHGAAEIVSSLKPCSDISSGLEVKMAIASDVSKDKSYSSEMNDVLRIADSSGLLQKEVENSVDSSRECSVDKNSGRKRRKLILADEDQSDEEVQFDQQINFTNDSPKMKSRYHSRHGAAEIVLSLKPCSDISSGLEVKMAIASDVSKDRSYSSEMNDALRIADSSGLLQKEVENSVDSSRECSVDKNSGRKRRKLILADEDQSDEEVQFDRFDQDALNKSMVQSNEPIFELSSSEYVQDSSNSAADNVTNMLPIASAEVAYTREMGHVESCDTQLNMSCHQASTQKPFYSPARPISDHIWRGYFNICNEEYGPLTAHLSSRACDKVWKLAKLLPPVLHMEKFSRLDAWPNSFRASPPTDDNIALYFLPDDARVESVLDQLLDDVINRDLVLKVIFDEVELLVFSSVILPKDYHRFLGKYYPWGVFRRRQAPVPSVPENCFSKSNELAEERCNMEVEVEACDEKSFESVAQNGNDASLSLSLKLFGMQVPVPSISVERPSALKELAEEEQKEAEVQACDAKSSDNVSQNGNGASLSRSFKLFGTQVLVPSISAECPSKLKELVEEEENMKGSTRVGLEAELEGHGSKSSDSVTQNGNDPTFKLFGWEVSVPSLSAECPELKELAEEEQNKGEFLDHIFDASQTGEDGACLELFPLRVEDMAISARVGGASDLDLKLMVCWR